MKFNINKTSQFARNAEIQFERGNIQTPAFMPVGTNGTVKGLTVEDLKSTGSEIILGNTYHLMLRPGDEAVRDLGGLHKFSNWDRPILTDSGGFQVWSLGDLVKISEEGVKFSSPYDGKKIFITPEDSIKIQENLGSDIVMAFDECTDYPSTYEQAKNSMELSMRWAKRCKEAHQSQSALFGIVQGGLFKDLRIKSLTELIKIGFDGYAMGGLAVGEKQPEMFKILNETTDYLPEDKPRYLMGVGTPSDILGAVREGIDMFDCVMPTRSGRTGLAFTWQGRINIKNNKYQNDNTPLDPDCENLNLNKYSKNYLNHLFNTNEILASMLLTLHNINFYQELMASIRKNINDGTFDQFHDKYIDKL